jgi:hypothetical protein
MAHRRLVVWVGPGVRASLNGSAGRGIAHYSTGSIDGLTGSSSTENLRSSSRTPFPPGGCCPRLESSMAGLRAGSALLRGSPLALEFGAQF